MEKLKKIEHVVEKVLEANEEARKNNDILYICVCEHFNPDVSSQTLKHFFMTRNQTVYPAYESVTRARRKVFEKRPELKPPVVTALRKDMEETYINYALS